MTEMTKNKPMTVGDIRNFIKDLPDDMEVLVQYTEAEWCSNTEMVPLGSVTIEEGKNGKVLEIYPQYLDC
jgi:hypothetical protein